MVPRPAVRHARRSRGFTLLELLIVVIILAALASISVPQFSAASSDARRGEVQSTVQTLRTQIALYRLQHGERLPDLCAGWDPFLRRTDAGGNPDPPIGTPAFGPYLNGPPANALNGSPAVVDGNGSGPPPTVCGYVYDYAGGTGSGRIWGTDVDGRTLIP